MTRVLGRLAAWIGWAALGAVAIAGLALAGLVASALSPAIGPIVAKQVVRLVDGAVRGTLTLEGAEVLPHGGIAVRGLVVRDPDGDEVLRVPLARLFVDVRRAGVRELGVVLEVDEPFVDLAREPDGSLSLANAFAPTRPSPAKEDDDGRPFRWTVRLDRLSIAGGEVRASGVPGVPDVAMRNVALTARGSWGPRGGGAELRLRAGLEAPVAETLALDVNVAVEGARLRASTVRFELGPNALDLVGEANLRALEGRVLVLQLGVARADLAEFVPGARALGGNLAGGLYAEADGEVATLSLRVLPPEGASEGSLAASAALRLPPAPFAFGFVVDAERVDPVRLFGRAPEGAITLHADGAAAGADLDTLRGHLDLRVAPSRVGKGTFGPVTIAARAGGGTFEVSRLDARLPGLAATGAGTWRRRGAVSGAFDLDAADVGRALRTIALVSGNDLPDVEGRGRVKLRLTGTASRPALDAELDAARALLYGLRFDGARLRASLVGPFRQPEIGVAGSVAAFRAGGFGIEGARVRGGLVGGELTADVTGSIPGLGTEPVGVVTRARFGERWERMRFSELALAWPGARFRLVRPAELVFDGPTVDRLELVSGAQRIVVEGGLGRRGRVNARAELSAVALDRLPPGLIPEALGLAGAVTLEATATGTTTRPVLDGRFRIDGGAVYGFSGLDALGVARWDAGANRLAADVEVRREGGGTIAVRGDVPLAPARAARKEPIRAVVSAAGIEVAEVLRATGVEAQARGLGSLEALVGGTVGAPTVEATATIDEGAFRDLAPLAARLHVEAPGDELRVELRMEGLGAGSVNVSGAVPLDLAALLRDPARTVAALRRTPAEARMEIPGLDLRAFAGRFGIPRDAAGTIGAAAEVKGTVDAPRGSVRVQLADGRWRGYAGLGATTYATLGPDRIAVEALGALAGEALVQLDASVGAPLEKVLFGNALREAPLRVDAVVPQIALDRAAVTTLPLAGTVEGRVRVTGTLARPVIAADARGDRVAVSGRPLGAVTVQARYGHGRGDAEAFLVPDAGGTLRAALSLTAAIGLDADWAKLAEAPARARVSADELGLGVLAVLLPGFVRESSGTIEAQIEAEGPLARLAPRGSLRVRDGRVATLTYGDWDGVAVEADLGADQMVLQRFRAERRGGWIEASGAIRNLREPVATIEAKARAEKLTVVWEGQDAATVDLESSASGTLRDSDLRARVEIGRGVVRIPNRTPRTLQSIADRPDIVIGRAEEEPGPAVAGTGRPFRAEVDVVIPARLQIVCDDPRYDLTLRGDTEFEFEDGELYTRGAIEVVRGEVEPLGGRLFVIQRGRVQFTGGPPRAAVIDAAATWRHAAATVTVTVTGPALEPTVRLSSEPAMDESQIAFLLATGRTAFQAGATTAGGGLTAAQAGEAAANAIATRLLDDVLLDKLPLPVDTVAVDTGGVRAGTYISDRVYVGYTRRFDAQPAQNENRDEFRVEYQITPHWTLEGQVGDQRSSGSLIWSKNY